MGSSASPALAIYYLQKKIEIAGFQKEFPNCVIKTYVDDIGVRFEAPDEFMSMRMKKRIMNKLSEAVAPLTIEWNPEESK